MLFCRVIGVIVYFKVTPPPVRLYARIAVKLTANSSCCAFYWHLSIGRRRRRKGGERGELKESKVNADGEADVTHSKACSMAICAKTPQQLDSDASIAPFEFINLFAVEQVDLLHFTLSHLNASHLPRCAKISNFMLGYMTSKLLTMPCLVIFCYIFACICLMSWCKSAQGYLSCKDCSGWLKNSFSRMGTQQVKFTEH